MSDLTMGQQTFSRVAFPVFRGAATAAREDEASTRGHAAGYAAGLLAAADETAALRDAMRAEMEATIAANTARTDRIVTALNNASIALADRQASLREETQQTLVAAALALAEGIIGYEIRTNESSTVLAALTRALTAAESAEVVAVRLNPDDLSVLPAEAAAELGVSLISDPSLSRGDAQADLPAGFIDAAIGSALERARTALALTAPAGGVVA